MARRADHREAGGARQGGVRRLIAGLRVTKQDEALLAIVRPYLADAGSEGEVAYRLWRRGLELTLAEVAGLGTELPPGTTEHLIAGLVAQRLLLCVPLLRRTGKLAILSLETSSPSDVSTTPGFPVTVALSTEAIDDSAPAVVAGLGGNDFL